MSPWFPASPEVRTLLARLSAAPVALAAVRVFHLVQVSSLGSSAPGWQAQCCAPGQPCLTEPRKPWGLVISLIRLSTQTPCSENVSSGWGQGHREKKKAQSSKAFTNATGTVGSFRPSVSQEGYILLPFPRFPPALLFVNKQLLSTSCVPGAIWGDRG